MTLTPTTKFILIATAFLIQLSLVGWTAVKIDVLALGMKTEVFNIGLTVLTTLSAGATALLGYLGLRAPTIEDKQPTP